MDAPTTPVSSAVWVGREPELAVLDDVLGQAWRDRTGTFVMVEGEAGIGKSTLLGAAVQRAEALGFTTARAGADPLAVARPFGVLLDALSLDAVWVSGPIPRTAELAVAEVHAMATAPAVLGRTSPLQAVPDERTRVIEALASLCEEIAFARPFLLVIDDLQWADPATLAALGRLHRLTASVGLVVVLALRPVPHNADLDAFLGAVRDAGVVALPLGPLAPGEVGDLVARLAGGSPGPELAAMAERAAGNPFVITELVWGLVRMGRIDVRDGVAVVASAGAPTVVPDLRTSIVRRMANLGSEATHLLQVAAALGRTFGVDELAAVLARPTATLLPTLQVVLDAGLLADEGDVLAFRHDLLREAVQSTVPVAAFAALHRDIAHTLAAAGAPTSRVAAHLVLGARPGDAAAVEWLRAAAREIVGHSPASAAELLAKAHSLVPLTSAAADETLAELVDATFWAGRVAEAADMATAALARPLTAPVARRLHESLARALILLGRPVDAVPHAEALVGSEGEDLAWATALVAIFRVFALDLDGAVIAADRALGLSGADEDPWATTLANAVRAWVANGRGYHDDAVAFGDRAVAAAEASPGRSAHRLVPYVFRGLALEGANRADDAVQCFRHGQAIADELGTPWATPFYHYALGVVRWDAGAWDDLTAECEAGLRYAREHRIWLAAGWALAVCAGARLYQGDVDAAAELLDEGDRRFVEGGVQFGVDWLAWIRGLLLEAQGRPGEALDLLGLAWDTASGLQAAAALVLVGPDLVRIGMRHGRQDRSRAVADAFVATALGGPRTNVDAHVARAVGLAYDDLDAIEQARRGHEAFHRPVDVVLDDEAGVLVAARTGRTTEAKRYLGRCLSGCDALGLALVARRVGDTAAAFGLPRPRRRRRGHSGAAGGWGALTDTERRIVALVAGGRSNGQIAAELYVSRRTVESHLYRVFTKLGVTNRTELAVEVSRRK